MPSSAFADPTPILAQPALDDWLATDLELSGLTRATQQEQVAFERGRVERLVRGGATAFVSERGMSLFRPLQWDSQHFGVGVADIVRTYGESPPSDHVLRHLLEHAARARVQLLSARCRAEHAATAQALEDLGFRWVDTSVEIGKRLGNGDGDGAAANAASKAGDQTIREARPEDVAALCAIAGQFRHNRFYNDAKILPEKAAGVYQAWVTNAAQGNGNCMFVAEQDNHVRGFCGYVAPRAPGSENPLRVGVLTLIVIDEAARGRGHFDALVRGVEKTARSHGAELLVSSTQVHNARALRAFSRHDLLPFSARHVFHRWST